MAIQIRTVLQEHGCDLDRQEFRSVLLKLKTELYPSLTDEQLSWTRDEAEDYCDRVRATVKCRALPRVFILGALNNIRKRSA